jgi:hypothetical protein
MLIPTRHGIKQCTGFLRTYDLTIEPHEKNNVVLYVSYCILIDIEWCATCNGR